MNILESFQISPPSNTVEKTSIPLTFYDIYWYKFPPMKRLFFYEFPHHLDVFLQKVLPGMKNSLSVTLQHFFPFASRLICPPPPHLPYISYSGTDNSVPLVIAAADSSASFDHLVDNNHVKDVKELHPFVPGLSSGQVLHDGTRVVPLLAVQITVFPSSGICIGFAFNHAVADGRAFIHFVKSWANLCMANGDLSFIENSLPCHNRDKILDPNGIARNYLEYWNRQPFSGEENPCVFENKVRANFIMSSDHIQNLKLLLSRQNHSSMSLHASTFVVTCAFLWICMVKAQEKNLGETKNGIKIEHLVFSMDCRNQISMPTTYFGNCLAIGFVSVKRQELLGEAGIFAAARAIGSKIKEMGNGALREAEKWLEKFVDIAADVVTVAASPKFRVYDTDFGWGKPKKSEVVHIDRSRTFSLNESRDEEGGVEVSLALRWEEMEVFKSMFNDGLNGGAFAIGRLQE